MAVALTDLIRHLEQLLEPDRFVDYAPNGLQVEGRPDVTRIVTTVSANQAAIDAAVADRADALVTHHGFFWRNEGRAITGHRARRLAGLLGHGISLLAYHLPLDAHAVFGNNVGLLRTIGARPTSPFAGTPPVGWVGELAEPAETTEFVQRVAIATMGTPLVFAHGPSTVRRVAAVSGGGAGYFEEAADAGVDAFVTGEPSEMAQGLAAELGITFVAAGHHRTERFGPRALGQHLAEHFGLVVTFVDIDNPA
jgi:dinuclear metal center YbgI/SA1388 family protein